MKIIDTKVHGYVDYGMGFVLLLIPSLLHLKSDRLESMIFYILGILMLFYSILTDYQFGIYKVLPMKLHLYVDILSGVFLAASLWIFGFYHSVFMVHVILGLIVIGSALITKSKVRRYA